MNNFSISTSENGASISVSVTFDRVDEVREAIVKANSDIEAAIAALPPLPAA